MARKLKPRRGTTAQNNAFTGEQGEITLDTTKNTIIVHDGSTLGGHPLPTTNDLSNELALKVNYSAIGAPDGVAPLGPDSKVPAANLPSYVDDVLEYADFASLPVTGEIGKIYITLDTNSCYRWSGSVYIKIADDDVLFYADLASFPVSGSAGAVYLALDTKKIYIWTGAAYEEAIAGLSAIADQTLLGNISGGVAAPVALAKTQVQTLLDIGWVLQSRSTASPNAAIPVHALTATGAEENIDLVLAPKGNGAILAQVPDGTALGGNKRGTNAIDLQMGRSTAAHVASGFRAVTIGSELQAAGNDSHVVGRNSRVQNGGSFGADNNQSAVNSGYFFGKGNTTGSSDSDATVLVGVSNTSSSNGDKMVFGRSNTTQKTSYCYGSSNVTQNDGGYCYGNNNQSLNNLNYLFGNGNLAQGSGGSAYMFGNGNSSPTGSVMNGVLLFGASNKNTSANTMAYGRNGYLLYENNVYFPQILITTDRVSLRREMHQRATTTDATATVLTATGTAATSANALNIAQNTTAKVTGHVVARTTGGDYKVWKIDAVINKNGANTLAIPTATPVTAEEATGGAAAWDLTFTVSSDLCVLTATGAAATTIKWFSVLDIKELGV